jgi:hypothetical protein
MAARFNAHYGGIGEMLRSDFIAAEMLRRAEKVKAQAEATAPYDPDDPDQTHYRDAFRTEVDRRGGAHHDRAVARVVNDDKAAFFVEYGTRNNDRHRTLGKALDAARG